MEVKRNQRKKEQRTEIKRRKDEEEDWEVQKEKKKRGTKVDTIKSKVYQSEAGVSADTC